MKRFYVTLVTSLVLTLTACNGQDKTPVHSAQTSADSLTATYNRQLHPPFLGPLNQQDPANQISPFVRRIFQDQVGSMWFGTNGDGVIRYQGDSLQYLSVQHACQLSVRSVFSRSRHLVHAVVADGPGTYDVILTGFRRLLAISGCSHVRSPKLDLLIVAEIK